MICVELKSGTKAVFSTWLSAQDWLNSVHNEPTAKMWVESHPDVLKAVEVVK